MSTIRYVRDPDSAPARIEVIAPTVIDDGAVSLILSAAVHRAEADLLIEWEDVDQPALGNESWIKLEKGYSGRLDIGDYQRIQIPIPETGGPRRLRITRCYWAHSGDRSEPSIVLCSRPCLVGAFEAEATRVIAVADSAAPAPDALLELPVKATTEPLRLETPDGTVVLVPQADSTPRPSMHDEILTASAEGPTRVSLHVNGNRVRALWADRDPVPLDVDPETLRNSGTVIELRDVTGNCVHARFTPAPSASAAFGKQRHPDAPLIEAHFDRHYYLSAFAKDQRPRDPISHYLTQGWREGRDPAPWFSTRHYLAMHPDVAAAGMNPFLHYAIAGQKEGRALPKPGQQATGGGVYAAHATAVSPGPHFEEFDPTIGLGRRKRAKVPAYYLPQFPPVPVNDTQWGKGFTEWRQLPRALPRVDGHIQPRLPRDLGFYSLDEGETMRRQIDMARAAGVHGFCFYHYWFDGQRVLETPMERLLADPSLDFPFCLIWANENWTRTWDGSDKEVILAQTYRDEDDIPFIDDLARHMKDPRSIRIGDRPLFFIYRPGAIPDATSRIAHWRTLMAKRHALRPVIMMAQGFGSLDPRAFGLDGAIEFPPHKLCQDLPALNGAVTLLDPDYAGHIVSYDAMVERAQTEAPVDFPLIKTVTPSWDNEARRPGRGMILHGSNPGKFQAWTEQTLSYAESNPVFGEHFIGVNAWNEWAEGAVLEPDIHHGAAYLNALSRAVHDAYRVAGKPRARVVIVGHDAHVNGAQLLALNLGRVLSRNVGASVAFVLGGDGPLLEDYRKLGPVFVTQHQDPQADGVLRDLAARGRSPRPRLRRLRLRPASAAGPGTGQRVGGGAQLQLRTLYRRPAPQRLRPEPPAARGGRARRCLARWQPGRDRARRRRRRAPHRAACQHHEHRLTLSPVAQGR